MRMLGIATDINIQICKPDYLKCYHIFNLLHSMYYRKVVLIKYHQLQYFNKQGLAGIYSNTQYLINHSENN